MLLVKIKPNQSKLIARRKKFEKQIDIINNQIAMLQSVYVVTDDTWQGDEQDNPNMLKDVARNSPSQVFAKGKDAKGNMYYYSKSDIISIRKLV